MSEQTGEKTEQPTLRRLEQAWRKGQFPRSAEVQTICVLGAGLATLLSTGPEMWHKVTFSMTGVFTHLHEITVTPSAMPGYFMNGLALFGSVVWPVVLAAMSAGLVAGVMQSRFKTASEALSFNWERLNPASGFKRIFSVQSAAPTGIALLKLAAIMALTYGTVITVMADPIFFTTVNTARIAQFVAETSFSIITRVAGVLMVIAGIDYGFQFWRTHQDLMMTRDELKQEMKDQEGNPQIKARRRRRRQQVTKRKMLLDVPKADVVVTNPTHLAIALRYDRKTMRAPKIVAKGSRLNALRIREIAAQHQVPILENKPLARMMFKHGAVGGEIPVQLYSAVAEILAWVYRVNRYRYYTEENKPAA